MTSDHDGRATSKELSHARHLLATIEHATVATVTTEGRPWNTPVYFAHAHGSIYWASRNDTEHSKNIQANGRVFLVVYDSSRPDVTGAALYVEAEAWELSDEDRVHAALAMIYGRRKEPVPSVRSFLSASPHRVYHARAVRLWTNVLHSGGGIPWDERVELGLHDL